MLSRLVKEHQDKQSRYKDQQEKRRKEALASVQKLTHTMVDGINLGVETAYENQRKLDQESKKLLSRSTKYMKQTSQWLSLVEGLHNTLKGLGDLEQWAKAIEADMGAVLETLERVHKDSASET
ncbi:biogenesis of lysosome-related organelles complex 1 subunit 1-like [Dysidea avara]|uniref:biogenesis of lysosome-related organelles complex 1 subunit 1-like n=1 Tax=Dysidea avara TaxID=196820 RepID=UPI0033243DAD